MTPSPHITRPDRHLALPERERRNGHRGGILWLTGLSASGKSTLAAGLERRLFDARWQVLMLDGDDVRHGLCADLGFSPGDRAENIRRVGEAALLMAKGGTLVVAAFISPYRADRDRIRAQAGGMFHEIHLAADLAVCERRDPKGLSARARAGGIAEFTGISAPYEPPLAPELVVETGHSPVADCLEALVRYAGTAFAIDGGA